MDVQRHSLVRQEPQAARRISVPRGSRSEVLGRIYRALKDSPDRLDTLTSLYKFYYYRGRLQDAEDVVFQSLVKASRLGRFDNDWNKLDAASTDWSDPRGPGRIYLRSLKMLAAIRERQGLLKDARRILASLGRIDPDHYSGAGVTSELPGAGNER